MSKDFTVIYNMLKALCRHMGDEDFNRDVISAETLGIPYIRWEQLLIELQRNGYIDGVIYTQTMSDKFPHIVEPVDAKITLKGMEYLDENTMMKKAAKFLKGVKETIPGI